MPQKMIVLLGVTVLAVSLLAQQDDKGDPYRAAFKRATDRLKSDDSKMVEKLRLLTLREFYRDAARIDSNRAEQEISKIEASMYLKLARMGYHGLGAQSGEGSTRRAILAYQKDRSLTPTGELNWEILFQLHGESGQLDRAQVALPFKALLLTGWDEGYVAATGTWEATGGGLAWRDQSTELTCYKADGRCYEFTAFLERDDDEDSKVQLHMGSDIFEIERWSEIEIVTKPLLSPKGCVAQYRRVNKATSQVTGLRVTVKTNDGCENVSKDEIHTTLVDGGKRSSKEIAEAVEERLKLFRKD